MYDDDYIYHYEVKEKKNFYERLNTWLNNKKTKDDERKELILIDKNTERPLFTPDLTLTKNKKFENSRAFSPQNTVSDFLHSDGMAGHKRSPSAHCPDSASSLRGIQRK